MSEKLRKTYTTKLECPAEIIFKLSKCGSFYIITSLVKHENHTMTLASTKFLPQNRKLTVAQKEQIKEVKESGGSKLKLISKLHEKGSSAILRDISNVHAVLKKSSFKDSLPVVVDMLNKHDASYGIKCNENDELEVLCFFTPTMSSTFNAWPEFCLIDSTYKLLKLDYPVVLLNIVDGNGATEIVGVCIVATETEQNLKWFLSKFREKHSQACCNIRSFMGDKDISARNVIKNMFHVPMYICAFHTARIFGRTITTSNMNISQSERDDILKILQKMIYATSESNYLQLYEEFCQRASDNVRQYFNDNWHDIRQEWVKCFMTESNFLNDTNNRTESINAKLKLFCETKSFLTDFISDFLMYLKSVHYHERDYKAVLNFTKVPAFKMSKDLKDYFLHVTKFAFDHIQAQIESVKYVLNVTQIGPQRFNVKSNSGVSKYFVTPISCTCKDYISMGLPCRHIFQVRSALKISLFDKNLVIDRWTKKYFQDHHRIFNIPKQDNDIKNNVIAVLDSPSTDNSQKGECSGTQKNDCIALKDIENTENDRKGNAIVNDDYDGVHSEDTDKECNDNDNVGSAISIEKIKLVNQLSKRGRPKGRNLTAIGLPKKQTCKMFNILSNKEKAYVMFSWLIPNYKLKKINLEFEKINVNQLRLKQVPCWFYNEDVQLDILKAFMDADAFQLLQKVILDNSKKVNWICQICKKNLHESQRQDKQSSTAVICEHCLKWFHLECLKMEFLNEQEPFFCQCCL